MTPFRLLSISLVCVKLAFSQASAITIQAGTVLDGKGAVLKNVRITIQGANIVRVEEGKSGGVTYPLDSLTVMPGWIDTHVHIGWHFNREGRADTSQESPAQFAFGASGNAYATLMAGFTTVQSLGAMTRLTDVFSRDLAC